MTVKELIAKLTMFDPEAEVVVSDPSVGDAEPVTGVWLQEGSGDDDEDPVVEITYEP